LGRASGFIEVAELAGACQQARAVGFPRDRKRSIVRGECDVLVHRDMVPRCCVPGLSAAAQRVHDFHAIAFAQCMWGCALRGTMLPLTSTATRRSTSPVSASRLATVEPSGRDGRRAVQVIVHGDIVPLRPARHRGAT
jgi:hypothetical protein